MRLVDLSFAILTLTVNVALAAQPPVRINNDACLSETGQAGIEACADLTEAIGRDLARLNANARVLEELGRHESALHLYTAAAGYFPNDKRALQGLIRSRANARASRIITDIAPKPTEVSACWTERWMRALDACRREVARRPDDARLQERLGDVARSVGDVGAAQSAYALSLRLEPDNDNLHRKRNALTQLLAGTTQPAYVEQTATVSTAAAPELEPEPDEEIFAPPEPAKAVSSPPVVREDHYDATIRQLELLETLKAKRLIEPTEYQDRRARLLAKAFAESTQSADTNVRYRGLTKGRYHAVVIGNDRYADFPELLTASADARAVSALLRDRYGFRVTTLIDANRYEILSALSDLRRDAGEDDSILLYYAGHGLLDEAAGRGYWLPVDAERGNFAQWISTNDIAGVFAGAEAKHAMVIADSCFAGTLLRSVDGTGWETLQRLATKRSRTVLTSGGLEPVVDDGNGTHSVFAAALLDALETNDAVLEASKLFASVRERVVSNADQTPQYAPMQTAGHDGGDFLFIPKTLLHPRGTY